MDLLQLWRYKKGTSLSPLHFDKGIVFDDHIPSYNPNDWYMLIGSEFSVYYTSRSEGLQTLDFVVRDNFGKTSKLSFRFTDSI